MKFDQSFKIGCCQIIPIEYAIQFDGQDKQSLQPKFIEVLCYLAQEYPRVIPRDELIENIWAGNSYVGEKALTNAVWHLRQSFNNANTDEEFIETIRKVGYRLMVEPKILKTEEKIYFPKFSSSSKTQEAIPPLSQWKKWLPYFLFCTVALLFVGQLLLSNQLSSAIKITQITKEPGSELFPSPSPDGRYVVYMWSTPGKASNLYMHDNHQPELPARQLTFNSDSKSKSIWSNDGQNLFYVRKNRSQKYCEVIKLKVKSNQVEKIADCALNGGYYYIDISPNDELLAYRGFNEPADDNGIYFISLKEKNAKPYRFSCANNCGYEDRDFAFSPDGVSIAVTRRINRFNENIYLVNLETKETEQLTKDEEDIVGLTWHPSGKKILFGTQRADDRNGFELDVESKTITPLQIKGFSYPAYAKENSTLYFQQRNEKYHISSLKLNQTIATSPFPVIQSDFNHHYPDYSPIAKRLVYVSNESGYYELWSSDNQGHDRTQLTNLKQTIRYPRWSHDGNKIAFLAPTENETTDKIYILDVKSKSLSILSSPFTEHNRPTWSFDDSAIISAVYGTEYTDLHQISIKDGNTKRISFDGGRYGIMISPTVMLYTRIEKGLWQKDINSQTSPINKINGKSFSSTYSWTYYENGIYFRQNYKTHQKINFYNFDKQQDFPLARLAPKSFESYGMITFVPELDKLIFAASQFPQADIKSLSRSKEK